VKQFIIPLILALLLHICGIAHLWHLSPALARGEGRIITEQSMRELASEVKQRGRARLAAGQTASL